MQNQSIRRKVLIFIQIPQNDIEFVLDNFGNCRLKDGDKIVADFVRLVRNEPNRKGTALDQFQRKFADVEGYSVGAVTVLIRNIGKLCGLQDIGGKALNILSKLISCDHNRYYQTFNHELLNQDLNFIRELKLDLHINRQLYGDVSSAMVMVQMFRDHYKRSSMPHTEMDIVSYKQLNSNVDAVETFIKWESGDIRTSSFSPVRDSPYIDITYGELPGNLQIFYTHEFGYINVNANVEVSGQKQFLMKAITSLKCRKQWDKMLSDCRVLDKTSNRQKIVEFTYRFAKNDIKSFIICQEVLIKSPTTTIIKLKVVRDYNNSGLQDMSDFLTYTIRENLIDKSSMNISASYQRISFMYSDPSESDSESDHEEFEDDDKDIREYLVNIQLVLSKEIAKSFYSELSCETFAYRNSILRLKKLVETKSIEESLDITNPFIEGLDAKRLPKRNSLRFVRDSRNFSFGQ